MRRCTGMVAAALLAWPGLAAALETTARAEEGTVEVFGIPIDSLTAGIGYSNYTGEIAPDVAPGVGWNLRLDLDTTQPVELEIHYSGAVNSITAEELTEFNLYTNQIQAAAQLQPWRFGGLEPYVSGGIGLTRVSVAKNPDLNAAFQSDTMGSVPLAAGVEYPLSDRVVVGARAQWDIYFDNELIVTQDNTDSDRWGILVNVGASNF